MKTGASALVFIGDSITEFWTDLAELQTESVAVVNRGIRGQNSSQLLLRFEDDAVALQPACIVLLCGTNDLRSYVGDASSVAESARQRVVRNVTAMADIARARRIALCLGAHSAGESCASCASGSVRHRRDQRLVG